MKATKVHNTPACPYTFPHKSRVAKVDYICGIGGYYSRDGRFPIEFNVAADSCNFDFDHIWEKYNEEMTPDALKHDTEACTLYYRLAKRLHGEHEQYMWEWGQEDAVSGLQEGDAYRSLWDGTEVSVTLELHGRCGKHLIIAEFENTPLRGLSEDDLRELLMEKEGGEGWTISTKKVDLLYRYVRQCEVDFTPAKASEEVECQGAFCFFANIVEPKWETEKKNQADHESVVGCAQTLRRYLEAKEGTAVLSMLTTLCKAAGVSEEELNV